MTPQPGKQTIAIQIFCNISRSKGQSIKLGQLIEYNREIFSLKNHTKNVREKPEDPFL